jgi:hypothetical protein
MENVLDNDNSNNTENNQIESIPMDIPLTDINLPNQWVLYLYDKQLFKKMANRPHFQAKPHKELCTISTVNDLMYILRLMEVKIEPKIKIGSINNKINLDANDYIIMRKGIEPIWEDPKNSNGGTFTIKMAHSKGYETWATFLMFMMGETMTFDMNYINGITVSYISDSNSFHNPNSNSHNSYTYIKIWDGKPGRTRDQFINILPFDLVDKIKNESLMYSLNNTKKDYGDNNIISKLQNSKNNNGNRQRDRGGFVTNTRRRY